MCLKLDWIYTTMKMQKISGTCLFSVSWKRIPTYFKRIIYRLMMNLFAEQSSASIAHALRILTLFDKHFQRLWKPTDFLVQKRSLCENK